MTKLIITYRNMVRMPVWLGACCVLTLLGISLFTQNAITRTSMEISTNAGGSVNVLRFARGLSGFARGLSGTASGEQGPNSQIASYGAIGFAYPANLIQGYSSYPTDDLSLNGKASCNTMNCTFEPYDTLTVCAHCEDISQEVYIESGRSFIRSGILSLDYGTGLVNITSDTKYPNWSWLSEDTPAPLLVHYLALAQALAHNGTAAVECAAYWCVATYKSHMSNGTLYEMPWNTTSSAYGSAQDLSANTFTNHSPSARTDYGQKEDIYIRPDTCRFNGTTFTDSRNCAFRVEAESQNGLQNFLSKGYFGGIPPLLNGSSERVIFSNALSWRTTSFAANAIASTCADHGVGGVECQVLLDETLATAFTNMTAFMSNVIRKSGTFGPALIYGTSHELTQVYDIR